MPGISISGTIVTCRAAAYATISRICVLGVEAAVRRAVADVGIEVLSDDGLLAPGADLGEARVLLDLEPPSLVVGQVQVQGVELVEREEVDELLDELRRVEPAGHVEENAAIAEAGGVLDLHGGDEPTARTAAAPSLSSVRRLFPTR